MFNPSTISTQFAYVQWVHAPQTNSPVASPDAAGFFRAPTEVIRG